MKNLLNLFSFIYHIVSLTIAQTEATSLATTTILTTCASCQNKGELSDPATCQCTCLAPYSCNQ